MRRARRRQQPDRPADFPDVPQDVVDRGEHQRRNNAEQIGVLQRLGEHHKQLFDLAILVSVQ